MLRQFRHLLLIRRRGANWHGVIYVVPLGGVIEDGAFRSLYLMNHRNKLLPELFFICHISYDIFMSLAIGIKNLSVLIDKKPILTDISVDLEEGKIIGLLGPSGAGKTTMIRAILGLQRPSLGNISVLGFPAGTKHLRSVVGYVTQDASVYTDLSVSENLSYFAALLGADQAQVGAVIAQVELTGFADSVVAKLSGGERARVSLAVALLGKPKILLLDEPTVGLDPVLRLKLWGTFSDLAAKGITLLVTSHVMDEADHCDDIVFLRGGRLLAIGTPKTIIDDTGAADMEGAFLKLARGVE
jgi:ABC-2 type transport system ATP-binding protein